MPVTILHLIGQMERGGTERQLLYLAQALKDRGWQQAAITFSPGEAWDDHFSDISVPLFNVPRGFNRIRRLWQLSSIVRRERPAVIHSWSAHTNLYAHWVVDYPKPRRLLAFRYNPTVDSYTGEPLARVRNGGIYGRADCVVSNSRTALECARSAGVRMRRSEVVNNIIPAHNRAKPAEVVGVPRILAVGALIPVKAYDVLLEALAKLDRAGYAFEFLLAGDGPEKPALEAQCTKLGLSARVRFLGGVENVPSLLATGHLLVHPSRSEGLSNAILEAMAEGLPVVATAVGGTPEFLSDGKNGLLVQPDQVSELADRISQLLDNPLLRGQFGSSGYELVRERCSAEAIAARYESIYNSIIPSLERLDQYVPA